MKATLHRILFLLLCSFSSYGQVEINPYLGVLTGDRQIDLVQPADDVFTYTGDRLLLGADVLFGAGNLAPLVGLSYQFSRYETEQAPAFDYGHLRLPLGLAYRLLPADLDLNVVLTVAVAPGLSLGDDRTETVTFDQSTIDWAGRGAVTLYLDLFTVGIQCMRGFSASGTTQELATYLGLTAGARF
ncbi:hypothetical protein LEM8419_00606 [Neolewinella maritima]|uniref:Outer membrane protein beta-barrel domain-containing protein n=1 Tax=Neolewinella maritima TaxID=1383882 RepID=A0ABM9AYB9_9BACT|nr:hypothetical protein [Neolewinella maritima]CAH0999308.1 hypothetical protein LEM8419_00606 [Neolewinella maritima]